MTYSLSYTGAEINTKLGEIDGKLPIAGGTVTGNLTLSTGDLTMTAGDIVMTAGDVTLSGAPTTDLMAATKKYVDDSTGTLLLSQTTIDIGDWDMDSTASITVAHGLSATEWKTIRQITVIVRNDADSAYYDLTRYVGSGSGSIAGGIQSIDATNVTIGRSNDTGQFNRVDFDSTSYNRGWITVAYTPD